MSQLHASVLQFLINNGYLETAESFKREARHHLSLSDPNETISDEDQLVQDLSQLQIQRYIFFSLPLMIQLYAYVVM